VGRADAADRHVDAVDIFAEIDALKARHGRLFSNKL
jgi:hypothetical protein